MFGKLKQMVDEQEKADAEIVKQEKEVEQIELTEKEEAERNAEREEMEKELYGNTLSTSRKKKLSESLERRKQEEEERKKAKEEAAQKKGIDITRKAPRKKMDPYRLRLLTEIPGLPDGNQTDEAIDLPGVICKWEDMKKDIRHFDIFLLPQEGRWQYAKVHFLAEIPTDYPISPPKVKCDINTRVYHPNIDLNGNVCLSILKVMNNNNEGWKPVLGISHLLFGLLTLFYDPNPDDPLNHAAAKMMINDGVTFDKYCYDSIRGGHVEGSQFPNIYTPPKY